MNYKFAIGQEVLIIKDHPWIGEYDCSATIIGYSNVFFNNTPTYKLKTLYQEILEEVPETQIKIK